MRGLLLQGGGRCLLQGGRVLVEMDLWPAVCIPSNPPPAESDSQDEGRRGQRHPHSPTVATPTMVLNAPPPSLGESDTPVSARPPDAGGRPPETPRRREAPPDSMEDNPELLAILQQARKPSTRKAYAAKWRLFRQFAQERGVPFMTPDKDVVLRFLLHLKRRGLSMSTLRVYLSAIVAHQPPDSEAAYLFQDRTLKRFLRGLAHAFPDTRGPTPQWCLTLVLRKLTKPPFEPLAHVDLRLLSMKTAFLLAITSARRASEMAALRSDPPYLHFHKDKVVLYEDISFLPKVVTPFHLNQPLVLPVYFPAPSSQEETALHSLDVRRALAYYVERTKDFRKSPRLFVSYSGPRKGLGVSAQRLSKWITSTIQLCYQLANEPLPQGLRGHSTRAVATSTAFMKGVPLPEICAAATWAAPSTFARHYRLDLRARSSTRFGRAVLSASLA